MFLMNHNSSPIGIVSHDAGGAEILSSYVRQQGLACIYCVEEPARSVFARKLGHVESVSIEEIVERSDRILCGTSFLSDLEWRALGLARQAAKRSVSMLDHWVNYRQRFLRHGEWHFPDEVWVGDELGAGLARAAMPEIKVIIVPNAYVQDIEREFAAIPVPQRGNQAGTRILYVCEPLREDGLALYGNELFWGYTEEDALRYFMSNVSCLAEQIDRIVVRPHPQESRDKYNWVTHEFDLPIVSGENKTLLEQLVVSDVVVGCASMAMVIGLIVGKRVVSCIPPGGKASPLPHPAIEKMRDLIALHRFGEQGPA